MELPLTRFGRPREADGSSSPNLYVANCGPAVGITHASISEVFGQFGDVKAVHAADESGARVIVCFSDEFSARAALEALHGRPCSLLGGRTLHIRYSIIRPTVSPLNDSVSVSLSASELDIPGLYLLHDFVTAREEEVRTWEGFNLFFFNLFHCYWVFVFLQELLLEVDARPWNCLAKRRVQHYGYEFCYQVSCRTFWGSKCSRFLFMFFFFS